MSRCQCAVRVLDKLPVFCLQVTETRVRVLFLRKLGRCCQCHNLELSHQKGDTFPPSQRGDHAVNWKASSSDEIASAVSGKRLPLSKSPSDLPFPRPLSCSPAAFRAGLGLRVQGHGMARHQGVEEGRQDIIPEYRQRVQSRTGLARCNADAVRPADGCRVVGALVSNRSNRP